MRYKIFSFLYKILGLMLIIYFWGHSYFWWIITAYIFVFLIIVFIGVYFMKFNFFVKSITKSNNGIVLTFDDGPDEYTGEILNALKKYNYKATFFVIGKKAEKMPEMIKKINDEGHVIGNHSYSHHYLLPFYRSKKLLNDFIKTQYIIENIIHKTPLLIRPPFGVTSPKYTKAFFKTPYIFVGWSFRSFDTTAKNKSDLVNKTIKAIQKNKNQILLFHDNQKITAQALPEILEYIKNNGIKVADLTQLNNVQAYEKK